MNDKQMDNNADGTEKHQYFRDETNSFQKHNNEPVLHLAEASGFSLGLKKGEDISLTDGPLYVTDDRAVLVVIDEFDTDLETKHKFLAYVLATLKR